MLIVTSQSVFSKDLEKYSTAQIKDLMTMGVLLKTLSLLVVLVLCKGKK